jgi:two-component system, NtrC family, response regulator HydG
MRKARTLVIDDEPSVVDALKAILSDSGYDAVATLTARDALERAKRQKFDLAIIDLKLPDMSGLVALSAILERCPDVVGILITAHDSAQVRADAMAAGFVAVLPKPFSPSTLLDVVHGSLSHRPASLR